MPEPTSQWGRDLVEQVEQIAGKVESLKVEVQKVDAVMREVQQLSTNERSLSLIASRVDTQMGTVVKHLEQLAQEMKGFAEFKATGQNIIGLIKWLFGGALAGTLVIGGMVCNAIKESTEVRTTVNLQGQRLVGLETATTKLQESTAGNATAARTLAESVDKNTATTKQLVADMEKELKALSSVKVDLAKSHETTARFFLTHDAIRKTNKGSVEFQWKLTPPIEKEKATKTKVIAHFVQMNAQFEPSPGFASANLQLRAGVSADGQFAWVELFAANAEKVAASLKNTAKTAMALTFTMPD